MANRNYHKDAEKAISDIISFKEPTLLQLGDKMCVSCICRTRMFTNSTPLREQQRNLELRKQGKVMLLLIWWGGLTEKGPNISQTNWFIRADSCRLNILGWSMIKIVYLDQSSAADIVFKVERIQLDTILALTYRAKRKCGIQCTVDICF